MLDCKRRGKNAWKDAIKEVIGTIVDIRQSKILQHKIASLAYKSALSIYTQSIDSL